MGEQAIKARLPINCAELAAEIGRMMADARVDDVARQMAVELMQMGPYAVSAFLEATIKAKEERKP